MLKQQLGLKNEMAAPKIVSAVLNTGIGRFLKDEKAKEEIFRDLKYISGQKPKECPAKKAIASFKTRKGLVVGYKVTLRGERMFDFLHRLLGIVLPRTKDFRGIDPNSIDNAGNLSIGIKEQLAFPEIAQENVRIIFGLQVSVKTSAKNKEEAMALFKAMGFPFKK